MSALKPVRYVTVEEYLVMERESSLRHEYIDGEIVAMTGARWAHNIITVNLTAALKPHLRSTPCRVASNDMKVRIDAANCFYYPDVLVSCESQDYAQNRDYETRPLLIIEILSASTAAADRTEKRQNYQRLESLREYVLVAQDQPSVEVYRRTASGWEQESFGAQDAVRLRSVDLTVSMADIYDGVPGIVV